MEEFKFNTVEEAIAAIKAGKMVLVTDDEDRENEGDLIMAAELCTPEAVNFMAKYARGLICMPAAPEIMDKLQFGAMVAKNTDNHETAFSVSIDHVDTTTGISAHERAYTMKKCADDNAQPDDFRRPGHVFPLRAREGGVLRRTGHTEATVDLCKLAGLKPVGICCEIMSEDGNMARTPELKESVQNSVKISIADDEHPLSYLFGTYAMEGILISQGQASPNGYDVTIAAHDAGALNEIEVDFGYPEVVLASVGEEDGETVITFYKNQDVGEAQAGYIAHFVWTTVEDGKQYYSETDNVMATYDNGIITLNEDNGFGFLAYESGVPYAWFEYWMQGSVTFTKK